MARGPPRSDHGSRVSRRGVPPGAPYLLALVLGLALALAGAPGPYAGAATPAGAGPTKVLHRQKSLYRDILVTQSGTERCMVFSVRKLAANRQSCLRTDRPELLVLDYTRQMMAGLYAQPAPRRILVVGLGGGILPRTLARLLPEAAIDVVEIDEAVGAVAQRWFLFEPSDRVKVGVQDGRVYVKRALRAGARYDLVFLDAYDHEYIPEHMLTREFLQEVRGLLAPGGVLVANTFSSSRLEDSESATYAAVFGPFQQLRTGNRVILAGAVPDATVLRENARRWSAAYRPLGVDAAWLFGKWEPRPRWRADARVLTDQYSPSNLLNRR